jgi:hypothetical protein
MGRPRERAVLRPVLELLCNVPPMMLHVLDGVSRCTHTSRPRRRIDWITLEDSPLKTLNSLKEHQVMTLIAGRFSWEFLAILQILS